MNAKYLSLVHAIQTGVAMDISTNGEDGAAASPKHLRVGINVSLVENSALWRLLLDKGIITEAEMEAALIAAHKDEVARYEAMLSSQTGATVKLS